MLEKKSLNLNINICKRLSNSYKKKEEEIYKRYVRFWNICIYNKETGKYIVTIIFSFFRFVIYVIYELKKKKRKRRSHIYLYSFYLLDLIHFISYEEKKNKCLEVIYF